MEYLVDPLNAILDVDASKGDTVFTESIMKSVFKHDNNDSLVKCCDVTGDDELEGVLHIHWGQKEDITAKAISDDEYVYDFCLFQMIRLAKDGQSTADSTRIIPATSIKANESILYS